MPQEYLQEDIDDPEEDDEDQKYYQQEMNFTHDTSTIENMAPFATLKDI